MPIHSIELKNFQSHADTTLALAPGLNIVRGPTNCGKTAVVRAIRWCLYGDGNWQSLCRNGTSHVAVTITFADGITVCRERDTKTNRYTLTRPEAEPVIFDSIGKDVPDEIQLATGFRKVELDGKPESVNLLLQHDPLFLLADAPSAVQRKLGILTQAERLEAAGRTCHTESLRARHQIEELDKQLLVTRAQLTALNWLSFADNTMGSIDAVLQLINHTTRQLQAVEQFTNWYTDWSRRKQQIMAVGQRLLVLDLDDTTQRLEGVRITAQRLEAMGTALQWYLGWQQRRTRLHHALQSAEAEVQALDQELAAVDACPLCGRPFEALQ